MGQGTKRAKFILGGLLLGCALSFLMPFRTQATQTSAQDASQTTEQAVTQTTAQDAGQTEEQAATQTTAQDASQTTAQEAELIKVGYADLPGFMYVDKDGNYAGYAYGILEEIGFYNNWKYEYIKISDDDCEELLNDGTIDIYLPRQKTKERMQHMDYCEQPISSNRACLLTNPDKDIYFNDFDHFSGLRVGVEENTVNKKRFASFFIENNVSGVTFTSYRDISEMKQALENDQIDAFICASSRGIDHCRMIAQLPETMSYVTAKKGNKDNLDKIDAALIKIHQNTPMFFARLEEYYYITQNGAYPALTREEQEYIEEKKTVSVAVGAQDMNAETQEFTGSIGKVLELVAERTGLTFVPVTDSSTTGIYDMLTNGTADTIFSFDYDFEWARLHNASITEPYAEFNSVMVKGLKVDTPTRVGVVKGSYICYYCEHHFPYELTYYDSVLEAIAAVKRGDIDATICSSPIGNYYATFPQYSTLTFTPMYDFDSKYSIAVSNTADIRLLSIMDKTMGSIPQSTMSQYFEEQITSRKGNIFDMFYENPVGVTIVALVMLAILLTSIFSLFYVRNIHQKNEQLLIANRAKTDFLSRMSHDIRTPLNGIIGMTGIVQGLNKDEKITEYLGMISSSGKFLLSLVNDILDISKIENGKLTLHEEPYSLAKFDAMLDSVIAPLLEEKKIRFDFHRAPNNVEAIITDPLRFNQIFFNLLSNAAKFTPEGGVVSFGAELVGKQGDKNLVRFIVRDSGCGMTQEFIEKCFEPFEQEEKRVDPQQKRGSGLGLSIAKQITELMGGTIKVESVLQEGTTFYVELPLKTCTMEETLPQTEAVDLAILSGKKVLLAEDNHINTVVATKILEAKGVIVDHAVNGEEAVEKFHHSAIGEYALILMDIRMPVMDGITATKTIRELDRTDAKLIPIVAMTANAYDEDVQNCKNAGMNEHLSKPIEKEKLYNTLALYFKEHENRTSRK